MVARGFEYGDIFMGKIIGWIKDNRLVATIIAVLIGVAGVILAAIIMSWCGAINLEGKTSVGDLLRTLILCVGGIGAAIGLDIAIKRQDKFSKQVQVQIDQGFNDRLGRGVELLAKEDMSMRCAGIQILKDLVDNADDRQKIIVARIIHGFFRDNARLKHNNDHIQLRAKQDRVQDLQDALDVLINLPLDVRVELRANNKFQLDFSSLDFSYLILECKTLDQIDFSASHFRSTKFDANEIKDVRFTYAKFMNVTFTNIKFKRIDFEISGIIYFSEFVNVHFNCVDFVDTIFLGIRFIDTKFKDVKFKNVKFKAVDVFRGKFHSKEIIEVSSIDNASGHSLPRFIATEIFSTEFNFTNGLKPDDFFELYYFKDQRTPEMDASREYVEREHGYNVFVKLDKPELWSEQPVSEWVAVEFALWMLDHKSGILAGKGAAINDLKSEDALPNAIKSLHHVQKKLGLPKKTPEPKTNKTP